ncbi:MULTISPECIES: protein translocase subunit SecF [unclassified Paenibacillus]|uniref:protein translocase subunit SecF n=1 Tax=Paenibacillus TaxID=44249 RepID=UPI000881E636|nr:MULTISPECIES: protein translocase subunit SecF [unclassified Paenibacillus]SDL58778.1 protein translocase subunit secF [Paenibacillus sp. OK060]SEB22489.1 SecD/SecF fusion protein [Paenibacillus sp. 276b]SLK22301.1 protein translocase subunit secF [Paenibacillus sp. RU5A]SOC77059.1 protein translocase subunit secF [Paenibacillus sp. RU26A]SOC78271.1 protein translocase subunit secF [Paenibacillus sp. RU5M]
MRFNWNFDYIKGSKIAYTFSIILTIAGIISILALGLNYAVDFRAGSNVDITVSKAITTEQINPIVKDLGVDEGDVQITTGADRVNVRFSNELDENQESKFKQEFTKLDPTASYEVNTVDPEMAKELERNAIYAVLIASIGIMIYVAIRFEWRFGLAAVIALFHDAFVVISVFSIFRLEVDLTFITAVLTIVGFSINDTIVIFDRIRENMRFAKKTSKADLREVVNRSLAQTMTRSLNTTFTVFVASLCLFIFGGESIRMFSLAMVIGTLFGAYSSIYIAAPLWLALKGKQTEKPKAAVKASN